jgi:hypothetical protein
VPRFFDVNLPPVRPTLSVLTAVTTDAVYSTAAEVCAARTVGGVPRSDAGVALGSGVGIGSGGGVAVWPGAIVASVPEAGVALVPVESGTDVPVGESGATGVDVAACADGAAISASTTASDAAAAANGMLFFRCARTLRTDRMIGHPPPGHKH